MKLDLSEIRLNIEEPMIGMPKYANEHNHRHGNHLRESDFYQNQEVEVSCIFKVFDDIRQDSLALQVIQLFMEIFQKHNLELKLFPYKTISNRTGIDLDIGGIIEVVPKTVSRDSIGKTNE